VIEACGLTKRYGSTLAVDDLSFGVRMGAVTGFLGPNGSGKSTTMRLLLGLDAPRCGGGEDQRAPVCGAAVAAARGRVDAGGPLLRTRPGRRPARPSWPSPGRRSRCTGSRSAAARPPARTGRGRGRRPSRGQAFLARQRPTGPGARTVRRRWRRGPARGRPARPRALFESFTPWVVTPCATHARREHRRSVFRPEYFPIGVDATK
jgi:energy-coupling factor transporter ATP-binding protein EcfA2